MAQIADRECSGLDISKLFYSGAFPRFRNRLEFLSRAEVLL